MTDHLDDARLSAHLATGSLEHEERDHLDACLACRSRLEMFRGAVRERRRHLAATAPDFELQREAILSRLAAGTDSASPRSRNRWLRPLLAAAATVLLVLGAGLLDKTPDRSLLPTPRPELPVEEILAQTDALLADDTIPGFSVLEGFSETEIDTLLADQKSKL